MTEVKGLNGWKQTITVVVTIISVAVASAMWLENRFHSIETAQAIDALEMDIIRKRMTEYGFSRAQAQKFANDLRRNADHPIPPIPEWYEVQGGQ